MKRMTVILALVMFLLVPIKTMAAQGNIEIQTTAKKEGAAAMISCTRVGTMVNGEFVLDEAYRKSKVNLNDLKTAEEMSAAAQTLMQYEKDGIITDLKKDGSTLISDLEEGVYLIHSYQPKDQEICPALIFLPTWMEEENVMLYNVTLVPKWRDIGTAATGDTGKGEIYLILFFISFIIIVGLSCHNRLKCGKIPLNDLKKGGYTNGNDNDTENPRCSCRFRFGGPRSVN